jgi:hypothetical protein
LERLGVSGRLMLKVMRELAEDGMTMLLVTHELPFAQRVDAIGHHSGRRGAMSPLSDGIPARRFPWVTVALIVANFAVFLLYKLPHLDASIVHASFYACAPEASCPSPIPWGFGGSPACSCTWVFLGVWFLYQFVEGNFGLFSAGANGGGSAFFAHVGGFVFGALAARGLAGAIQRERATATAA